MLTLKLSASVRWPGEHHRACGVDQGVSSCAAMLAPLIFMILLDNLVLPRTSCWVDAPQLHAADFLTRIHTGHPTCAQLHVV